MPTPPPNYRSSGAPEVTNFHCIDFNTNNRVPTQIPICSTGFIKSVKFLILSRTIVLLQLQSQYKGRISCNIAFY